MLNGIGGRTIAEAKNNITQKEAIAWSVYRNKYGSLNLGRRLEQGIALLAAAVINSQGGKADVADFMPHEPKPEEKVADINEVFGLFKKLKKVPA